MLTAQTLAQVMGDRDGVDYDALFPAFNAALIQADCTNVNRAAAFISQLAVESGGLQWMEELASGAEYEGRCDDLGNCQPGDGVRFKGRGPIQVTGRAHYQHLSQWAHERGLVPTPTFFVDNPGALSDVTYGFLGAVWYWTVARPHINEQADAGDIEGVSYAVNGGDHGLAARIATWNKARSMGDAILPDPSVNPTNAPVRPAFDEVNVIGERRISDQAQDRGGTAVDLFLLHTVEGNLDGEDLIGFMESKGERSYHYIVGRDGRTAWDLVDTDLAAWSVGDGNNRSINLVFGASFAGWSRQQWLDNCRDAIRVAAYLAVADCRKYGIDPRVLAPPYDSDPPGISDHRYVTQWIGWGDHTDVGDGFPWDTFADDVDYFLHGREDDMSADAEKMIREIHHELFKLGPTRSFMADDQTPIETLLGFVYNIDGNCWNSAMTRAYLFDVPKAVEAVERIAEHGVSEESWAYQTQVDAKGRRWLAEFGQAYCQGLMDFKAKFNALFEQAGS